MRLKTRIMLAAIPAAAIVVAGTVIAVSLHIRNERRKREASFLPNEIRDSLQELCLLKGEDFVPDKRGSSLYQRRLDNLTDKQLLGVYVAIKAAEVLRNRGVDVNNLSKEDVVREVGTLRNAAHDKQDRHSLLAQLGSIGAETVRSMLSDGLMIAGLAAQPA